MFVSVCTRDKSTVDTLGAPGAFTQQKRAPTFCAKIPNQRLA